MDVVEHRKHTFQYKHMHSNGVQQVETSRQEVKYVSLRGGSDNTLRNMVT